MKNHLRLLALIFLFQSCASIPEESVMLSQELQVMIMNSRNSHMELLNYNTRLQLEKIEDFINKEWTPDFLANFVANSGVLENIQKAPTNEEKGSEILEFAQAALPLIKEREMAMKEVVWSMNSLIRANLEEHYQEIFNINQALTAHLSSAAEVVQIRQKLQERMNLPDQLISIDRMNTTLEALIKSGTKAERIPQLLEEFKKNLK